MTSRFEGKVAFITGAAGGFGWAFARALSNEGAAVAIADIDVDGAQRNAAKIDSPATPAIGVACDVADDRSVERAVAQTVKQLGGVDILINNAARHLKKYNQPYRLEDVTNTMLFLCSKDASFITGETIRVTGGASLST